MSKYKLACTLCISHCTQHHWRKRHISIVACVSDPAYCLLYDLCHCNEGCLMTSLWRCYAVRQCAFNSQGGSGGLSEKPNVVCVSRLQDVLEVWMFCSRLHSIEQRGRTSALSWFSSVECRNSRLPRNNALPLHLQYFVVPSTLFTSRNTWIYAVSFNNLRDNSFTIGPRKIDFVKPFPWILLRHLIVTVHLQA
jgi:hypothetical protein